MANSNKRYRLITGAYWILLLYVVAALIWWFISLEQQNHLLYDLRTAGLSSSNPDHQNRLAEAADLLRRKHAQYLGEGIIFLLLILAGAVLVFRTIRRELMLSRQQQNFMMAITHELKTPIAAARLNIETLKRHRLDAEKTEKLLTNTLAETNRLNELADNILIATRLDSQQLNLQKEPVDMAQLAKDTIVMMQQRHPKMQWQMHMSEHLDAEVQGERLLLKLMLTNLMDNAAKYAAAGRQVDLRLKNINGQLQIIVADKGPGIPDTEKRSVFEKFYRIGTESNRSAKGTGLGLFLVDRIVADHRGTVVIENNQPAGARFIVALPLKA